MFLHYYAFVFIASKLLITNRLIYYLRIAVCNKGYVLELCVCHLGIMCMSSWCMSSCYYVYVILVYIILVYVIL